MKLVSSFIVSTVLLSALLCDECHAEVSFHEKSRRLQLRSAFLDRMRHALKRGGIGPSNELNMQRFDSPDVIRKLRSFDLKGTSTDSSLGGKLSTKGKQKKDDSSSLLKLKREEDQKLDRKLEDEYYAQQAYGYDDKVEEDDVYKNKYNNYVEYDEYFDLSAYSLKYHSCTSLTSYTGDQGDDQVFTTANYAVFRACPSEYCNDESWSGCRNNYGEFLIPLYDYMEAQENNLKSEMDYYCGYCQECSFYEYYFGGTCQYHDNCDGYEDICEEDDDYEAIEQFFQCQGIPRSSLYENNWKWWKSNENKNEVDDGDGEGNDDNVDDQNDDKDDGGYRYYDDDVELVYVGLHCTGKKIQFGLFSDDECTQYIGNQAQVGKATGLNIDDDDLKDYYTPKCTTCSPKEDEFTQYNYKYYGNGANEEEAEVLEFCENLYDGSAKCLSNLYSYSNMDLDEDFMIKQDHTCAFIENVARGNVNEYGFVSGKFSFMKAIEMILAEGWSGISVANTLGLLVTLFGCIAMLLYIRSLRKKIAEPRGFLFKHHSPSSKSMIHDPVMVTRQDTYVQQDHRFDPTMGSSRPSGDQQTRFDSVIRTRSID